MTIIKPDKSIWEYEDHMDEPQLVYIYKDQHGQTMEENHTTKTYQITDRFGKVVEAGPL